MFRFFLVLVLMFLCQIKIFGAEFGEYQYSEYLGIQQQLQNQRLMAQRRQIRYNKSPTRNIRYPNSYSKYPNIERATINPPPTRRQRFMYLY